MDILSKNEKTTIFLNPFERLMVIADGSSVAHVKEYVSGVTLKTKIENQTKYFGDYGRHNQLELFVIDGFVNYEIQEFEVQAQDEGIVSTGWATYVDTDYPDSGNAFVVSANTDTVLPNNAGSKIETQLPVDVVEFYNVPNDYDGATNRNATIPGRNGDGLDCMFYFKSVPSAANQWLDIWINIGGSVGELYRQTFQFPKGAGVERGVLYALPSAYTLGTWQANGGTVYVRSNASLDIYGINFNFDRSHKAR